MKTFNKFVQIAGYPAPYFILIIRWLIVILITIMSLAVLLQVIYRKILAGSTPWSEELARYLFVWVAWLGASIGIYYKSHFGIDILVNIFPKVLQKVSRVIVVLASQLFLGIAAYNGFILSFDNWCQLSPAMRIPMTLPYLSVPVCSILMMYFILFQNDKEDVK